MIRRFTLINGDGDRWSLNQRSSMAINPEFGFEADRDYANYKRVRRQTKETLKLGTIKFEIAIRGYQKPNSDKFITAYMNRYNLKKFMTVTPLRLEYSNDNGTFTKDIKLTSYPTDDKKYVTGFIDEVIFDELTPWYRYITSNQSQGLDVGVYGKTYYVKDPSGNNQGYYTYSYVYGASSIQLDDRTIVYSDKSEILLDEKMSGELMITLEPERTNVILENSVNGVITNTDAYNIPSSYLNSDYKLTVSSFEEARNAYLSNGISEVNAYKYQDVNRSNWIKFTAGKTNKLEVTGAKISEWVIREYRDVV